MTHTKPKILKKHQPSYANIASRCGHQIRSTNIIQHNNTIFLSKSNDTCVEFKALHKRLLTSKKLFVDKEFNFQIGTGFKNFCLKRPGEVTNLARVREKKSEGHSLAVEVKRKSLDRLGKLKIGRFLSWLKRCFL